MPADFTTREFIKHCELALGDKYDYRPAQYRGMGNPIVVSCRRHGGFETTPDRLLAGEGCPQCEKPLK